MASDALQWTSGPRKAALKQAYVHALGEWSGRVHQKLGKDFSIQASYRHGLGFMITRQGADSLHPADRDFLNVESGSWENGHMAGSGEGVPPVEGLLHGLVYQVRSSAIFCFTVTGKEGVSSVRKSDIPRIPWEKDLSRAAMVELEQRLGEANCFAVGGNGILSFGCTAEDAGQQIEGLF